MRVTLVGVLSLLGLAVLLVYAGYELRLMTERKSAQSPWSPEPPLNP
jgi:hypothetical protein